MDKKVTDLLYRSCQGALSDEEQKWLDEALARSEELRKEKELIDAFFKTARSSSEPSFAPFFDDRVMKKIKAGGNESSVLEPFLDAIMYAFRRVAVAGLVFALAIIVLNLGSSETISLASAFGIPEVRLVDAFDPFYVLNP